ncbi:uncharacterized protein LOC135704404 isoform X1 [Ochlerotatus camptorhynchus]|uniref:uncharacterized protein LOC135704404 isoform X1 n=1 Tax=Ochlerotatus camptorhynchus TaxID=644619 RepID=UPI0031D23372
MHLSKTTCLTVLVCLAAVVTSVLSQDDQPKANSRNNLLLRRGNIGRQNPLTKTTTTTVAPEYPEDEYVDEEGEQIEGEEGEEGAAKVEPTTTTTTETPRKIRPSIRPFRSNDDLLTTLKKRRQDARNKPVEAKEAPKGYDDEDIPAAAPAKSAKAPAIGKIADNVVFALTKLPKGRRFGPIRKDPEQSAAQSEQNEQSNGDNNAAKSLSSRLGRSRFALNKAQQ